MEHKCYELAYDEGSCMRCGMNDRILYSWDEEKLTCSPPGNTTFFLSAICLAQNIDSMANANRAFSQQRFHRTDLFSVKNNIKL